MASVGTRGRRRRSMNEINMVPFIDVMLVLLIIFMVTAPLMTPSMINLPSMGNAARQPDRVIQVIVRKDEQLQLKTHDATRDIALAQLVSEVKSAQSAPTVARNGTQGASPAPQNVAVVISADRTVQYEAVVKVMDTLQKAGIQRVGLSVQLVNN
ncbi:MAG: Biopolymer transport protein ExbD [Paracidovorax wautersii]|uniref:Biopolymer transport protein ExbD n=1 Tax=Paracidovorax wautersii TaxID=1177982 RepID=A0A7V8FLP9_9BURK|nr:MAG: Biopolymer transport protein ExbD [Paracidovorax wautersii]